MTIHRMLDQSRLEPVFIGWRAFAYVVGAAVWLGALVYFWVWWLRPDHVGGWLSFAIVTVILAWVTLIPGYFVAVFFQARRMRPDAALPTGRIAMIVTKAPSEPFEVVRHTLFGMLAQVGMTYDVWLADEDPSEETLAFCRDHGVFVSTRKGVAAYHRAQWPRRTRCKEGNLAYFYDHYGYDRYDFVAQFDADHVPEPTYLVEVMRPFADPAVGYVSAPSICDANASQSWAARGRLYAEASLHGALQIGYNNGWAPLCIGSHYAVRTRALKDIGGLGPELAEDHSTTLMMNAGGWRGVHAVDAIAHGDGPATFADLAVQEFQWSRSLTTLLLQHSAPLIVKLPPVLKFQFVFAQLWYPLYSVFMAMMFSMPLISLAIGQTFAEVSYVDFLAHFLPLSITLIGLAIFWRSTGLFRPRSAKLFGWEGLVFPFVRWPWSLAGAVMAVWDSLAKGFVDFRITPKDKQAQCLPVRVVFPYVGLAGLTALVMWVAPDADAARGFHLFAAVNLAVYAGAAALIALRHARENGMPAVVRSRGIKTAMVAAMAAVVLGGAQFSQKAAGAAEAMSFGQQVVSFSETRFTIAGAGFGSRTKITTFRFRWNGFTPATGKGERTI